MNLVSRGTVVQKQESTNFGEMFEENRHCNLSLHYFELATYIGNIVLPSIKFVRTCVGFGFDVLLRSEDFSLWHSQWWARRCQRSLRR